MRILLLGANGQVGYALHRSLVGLGEIIATTRSGRLPGSGHACPVADLDRPADLPGLVAEVAPDVVVNAAAYTAVDRAESEPEAAYRINAEAVGVLAGACRAGGALLVHYSTDYVFPGDGNRPWREDDATAPLGVYGASKLAGEEAIRASGCGHMIFRTAWVYGTRGHNFLRTMLRLGAEREELRVVADQVGSPTPARWIAQATALVLARRHGQSGTWHMVAGGETSWHGFAGAIFDSAVCAGLLPAAPAVEPIKSDEFPTPARRPGYSRLDTGRLGADFGIELPDWRTGLEQVVADAAGPTGLPWASAREAAAHSISHHQAMPMRTHRKPWLLIFNCQVMGLANCLHLLCDEIDVEHYTPATYRKEYPALHRPAGIGYRAEARVRASAPWPLRRRRRLRRGGDRPGERLAPTRHGPCRIRRRRRPPSSRAARRG